MEESHDSLSTKSIGQLKSIAYQRNIDIKGIVDKNELIASILDHPTVCSICYSPISEESKISLECKHKFHGQCIVNWFKNKTNCPICRNEHCNQEDSNDINRRIGEHIIGIVVDALNSAHNTIAEDIRNTSIQRNTRQRRI